MFKAKATTAKAKKEDVILNMVLTLLLAIIKSITRKYGIQGEKTSQEQECYKLAGGKISMFI
jgi:hypothetical protein